MKKIAIVGTGAWGTALAIHGARAGLAVSLLGYRDDIVDDLARTRAHPALPGAEPLPALVEPTMSPDAAFDGAEAVLWSVSVQFTATELERLGPWLRRGLPLASTSKGIEIGTHRRTSQMMVDALGPDVPVAVLSGPTFAIEVARGLPTVAVVACADADVAERLQKGLASPTFRLYRSPDVVGVEIAGATKNVVAIAAGIVDGLKLGQNTRAALLTRALAEIRRLGTRLGGLPETFSGLAGVGDLILTATGDLSRNRRVGLALASGLSVDEALASLGGQVAEGVPTAGAIVELARTVGVEMPISETVMSILEGTTAPREAVSRLMTRSLKEEGT
ncbi:MAG: NAD(P)-dependent glycerol-3-phosphate dehydrogenase [Thermoanaerobaculia bacterium]|nr:NAD(P)-dependent glycerol-3-phosphate dehydrogenase [Thermoanaerobaculia bacterium]